MAKKKKTTQSAPVSGGTIVLAVPEGGEECSVSIGNFGADLKPGSFIETESRKFADYLTANFGCVEVQGTPSGSGAGEPDENAGGGEE